MQRGDPPLRPRMFWPRPHRLEGHAGRAIPAPSTLHKGLVEARAISDPIVSSGRMQNERKANGSGHPNGGIGPLHAFTDRFESAQ